MAPTLAAVAHVPIRKVTGASCRRALGVAATDEGSGLYQARVLSVVRRIPPGRVATYGDVAHAAGRTRAWRAVGNIMMNCSAPDVPCHRVVAAAGGLGGYGGNLEMKRGLLRAEGVLVSGSRIRDFRGAPVAESPTKPAKPSPNPARLQT